MFVLRFLYLFKNAQLMWWLMYAGHLGLPLNVCRGYLSRCECSICRFSTPSSGCGGCFSYQRARSDKFPKDSTFLGGCLQSSGKAFHESGSDCHLLLQFLFVLVLYSLLSFGGTFLFLGGSQTLNCEALPSPADGKTLVQNVPVDMIQIVTPDDGLPSIDDWVTTAISFLFSGSRLFREPLDLNLKDDFNPGSQCFQIKKGFTRLNLMICLKPFDCFFC